MRVFSSCPICKAFSASLEDRLLVFVDEIRGIIDVLLRQGVEVDQRETGQNGEKWILGRSAPEMAARRLNDEISEELTHRFLKGGAEPEPRPFTRDTVA